MGGEFGDYAQALLLRFGGVLVLLVIVALFVRQRWANKAEERRLRGVVMAALVTIIGFPLYFGGLMLILMPFLLLFAIPYIFLFLVIPAFVAAGLVDLVFRALGAERRLAWLGIGIVAAIAIAFIWIGLVFQGVLFFGGVAAILEYAILSLVPIATALIWWSYLPLPASAESEVFD